MNYKVDYKIMIFSFFLLFSACTQYEQQATALPPSPEGMIEILKTNSDGLEYLEKNTDAVVKEMKVIKSNQIEGLRNQTRYKELYDNLPQKDLYYVEVISPSAPLSLISVIDYETKEVINVFGVFVVGIGA